MDLSVTFLEQLYMPLVCAFCLISGFILKKWIKDQNDKFIPTILTLAGAVLGCIINSGITLENIVQGAFSGLASTGMHQLLKQLLNK